MTSLLMCEMETEDVSHCREMMHGWKSKSYFGWFLLKLEPASTLAYSTASISVIVLCCSFFFPCCELKLFPTQEAKTSWRLTFRREALNNAEAPLSRWTQTPKVCGGRRLMEVKGC